MMGQKRDIETMGTRRWQRGLTVLAIAAGLWMWSVPAGAQTLNCRLGVYNCSGEVYINGGNVGIGTTNPGGKLDINGVTILHNGLRTHVISNLSGPNNSTDSYRFEIGRMGVNQLHWGSFGVITIELYQTYFDAGAYQKWYVKAGYGDYSGSAVLVEKYGNNQYAKVTLGVPVLTGNAYAGVPNQYIPIYIEIANYTSWRVKVTHHWPMTDNAVPEYSQFKFFESPTQTTWPGQVAVAPSVSSTVDGSLTIGQNTAGNNTDYAMQILRHGTSTSTGTYTANVPALVINDFSGDGPAALESYGLLDVRAPRIADTDPNAANALLLRVANDSGNALIINAKRNVGIGTTSPIARLHVLDDVNNGTALRIIQTNATASNGLTIQTQTTSAGDAALYVTSGAGSIPGLIVRNTGNVGIGTTAPAQKLDVNGNINMTGAMTGAAWVGYKWVPNGTQISCTIPGTYVDSTHYARISNGKIQVRISTVNRRSANYDSGWLDQAYVYYRAPLLLTGSPDASIVTRLTLGGGKASLGPYDLIGINMQSSTPDLIDNDVSGCRARW